MKRQITKFEGYAHDIQYRKRNKADHGQLGDDNRFFEKHFDGTVFIATSFLVVLALIGLAVIY